MAVIKCALDARALGLRRQPDAIGGCVQGASHMGLDRQRELFLFDDLSPIRQTLCHAALCRLPLLRSASQHRLHDPRPLGRHTASDFSRRSQSLEIRGMPRIVRRERQVLHE